jgi:hypothetical protein
MDLNAVVGPTVSLITALAALPLAKLAERGKENRLRKSIAANLTTISEIESANPTNKTNLIAQIEGILGRQMNALSRIEDTHLQEKRRNWATLAAAFFLTAVLTVPLWFMWQPRNGLTWTIFIVITLVAVLILIGGINACFNPDLNRPKEDSKPKT